MFSKKSGKPHYFGNIISYEGLSAAAYQERILVDGQQRITTILLYMLATTKYLKDNSLVDDKKFVNLDDILNDFMKDKNVKSIYLFESFDKLPNINVVWNPWLLYSVIKLYSDLYDVTTTSNHFSDAVPLIIKKHYILTDDDRKKFLNDKYFISTDIDVFEDLFDE